MQAREGEALVVSCSGFGERDALLKLLCPERGLLVGLVKGGRGKAAILQPFNTVRYAHYRRLEAQLGTLTVEMVKSRAGLWMGEAAGGRMVAYLSELLSAILPEEHPYEGLVEQVEMMLEAGATGWREVTKFELLMLEMVGYGLRLDEVVEGDLRSSTPDVRKEDFEICYVSPNSGRLVTRAAAKGYEARMLMLPHFLGGAACGEAEDMVRAWRLTGSFLGKALHGKVLAGRQRLADDYLRKMERVSDDALAA